MKWAKKNVGYTHINSNFVRVWRAKTLMDIFAGEPLPSSVRRILCHRECIDRGNYKVDLGAGKGQWMDRRLVHGSRKRYMCMKSGLLTARVAMRSLSSVRHKRNHDTPPLLNFYSFSAMSYIVYLPCMATVCDDCISVFCIYGENEFAVGHNYKVVNRWSSSLLVYMYVRVSILLLTSLLSLLLLLFVSSLS